MWLFLSGGLLLPSLAPMDKADPELTLGYRELQVRGRLTNHLQYFIDTYMEPNGLDHSIVEETPFADYNCRFYTTREAFATAMGHAVLDIDYRKFKQTAEDRGADGKPLYPDGKAYHSVLNSIWATSARLNQPGGFYGPRSKDNPKGYTPRGTSLGSTFHASSAGSTPLASDDWWEDEPDFEGVPDYESGRETLLAEILHDMRGIPLDQWRDELDDYEYELVKPTLMQRMAEERKANKRANRFVRRGKRRSGGKHKIR